jgi:hypothetical protein
MSLTRVSGVCINLCKSGRRRYNKKRYYDDEYGVQFEALFVLSRIALPKADEMPLIM